MRFKTKIIPNLLTPKIKEQQETIRTQEDFYNNIKKSPPLIEQTKSMNLVNIKFLLQ